MMELENPRLFIGGISREIDEQILREHFGGFGEVKHTLVIARKGIAFVSFSDLFMAQDALKHEHIILGKKVDVKPAKPQSEINNRKIFVGGLPPNIILEEVKEFFGSFGIITDAVIIHNKETRIFRGFGFVTYDSEEAVEKVLKQNFYELKNKMVEVKRARPKDRFKNTSTSNCGRGHGPATVINDFNIMPCYNEWYIYSEGEGCRSWVPNGYGNYYQVYDHVANIHYRARRDIYKPEQEWRQNEDS